MYWRSAAQAGGCLKRIFSAVMAQCGASAWKPAKPAAIAPRLLRLFRERMDALADPLDPGFGFDAMRLCVPVADGLSQTQISLDQRTQDDVTFTELIDRLIARFGRDRVLHFAARDTHDPSRAA